VALGAVILVFIAFSLLIFPCCAGTGRTGFIPVAPNNYPFYSSSDEVYTSVLQSDGGQLSGEAAAVKERF
jgi:hypothetical protein